MNIWQQFARRREAQLREHRSHALAWGVVALIAVIAVSFAAAYLVCRLSCGG